MTYTSSPSARTATALLAAVLVLFAAIRLAAADNVDKLIGDLGKAGDYKVRLSAAASLAKLGDARAVRPFIKALKKDKEKTVRGAAAVGLGKIVTSATEDDLREAAVEALADAAENDGDAFVKKQAKKALAKLEKLGGGGGGGGGGGLYIEVSDMASETDDAAAMRKLMQKTVLGTLKREASDMSAGTGKSDKELKKVSGFWVHGTLNSVSTKEKGSAMLVSCKVHMIIATLPDKSAFGFLDGGAKVEAANDEADIAAAKQDCVAAVIEDLTIKKIIPTIKAKSGR